MAFATVSDRYTPEQVEQYYSAGLWRSTTLFDEIAAQTAVRGDKVCFTDATTSVTYADLHDRTLTLAAGLHRRGVRRGDRVVVQLPNWTEFVVVVAAVARLGAVTVPVMPIYRNADVKHVVDTAGARMAVTAGTWRGFDHAAMFLDLAAVCPTLDDVVVVRSETTPAGALALDDLVADVSPQDAAAEIGAGASPDDPFVIVFSSGTTSRAKGCLHTFNTMGSGARMLAAAWAYGEADVQFGPSPVTHTTGLVTSVLMPVMHGASSHLMEIWEPKEGLDRIARFGCTACVTATTFLQMLVDAYDPAVHDASSMRFWCAAGSPIPGAFVERARATLPTMKVLSLYGRTENILTTLCGVDDDPQRSVTSDGKAAPGQEVRILDAEGNEVPRGQEGDICYRGSQNCLEYIGMPAETAEMYTADGFSRSGDLGVMDKDGYVRVTGRLKDIVIRGGLNISVREVEDVLTGHPAVAGVAVVGMPDDRLGERVCCFLVPAAGVAPLTLDEVREYLLGKGLAVQKVPERLEVVDALPTTATGKIQKNLLREDITKRLLRG